MLRRISLIALAGATVLARTQDAASAGMALSPEQIRGASVIEQISIPSPGEQFAAFAKTGKPDWSAMLRKAPVVTFTSRPQIALNLGALIADGHLAVEAQDKQEVRNISREIKSLAKTLGLEHDLVVRSNSIGDFADARQWNALSAEFEAVQNELAAAMNARQDHAFVTLMVLGGWLRTLEIIAGHLSTNYTPEGARALRQPALASYFARQLDAMPAKISASSMLTSLGRELPDIYAAVSFPNAQPPSAEDLGRLKNLTSSIVAAIGTPEK